MSKIIAVAAILALALLFAGAVDTVSGASLASGGWPAYAGNESGTGLSAHDTSDNPGVVSAIGMGANGEGSPVVAPDGTVYVPASPYAIVAIKDGNVKWHFPQEPYDNIPHVSTPVIDDLGNIYFGIDIEKKFYSLRPDGSILWTCDMPASSINGFTPAIMDEDGNIYFGAGFSFYSLSPSGSIRWSIDTPGYIEHMPVISGTEVFFVSASPNTVSYNSALYCVDTMDGTIRWKWTDGTPYLNSPSVLPNGTVMITGNDGYPSSNGYLFSIIGNTTGLKMKIGEGSYSGISLNTYGNIYFTAINGNGTSTLYKLHKNWTVMSKINLEGAATTPVIDSAGNVYVLSHSSYAASKLFAFDSSGNLRWSADVGYGQWTPVISPDGSIYVVQDGGSTLYSIGEGQSGGTDAGSDSGNRSAGEEDTTPGDEIGENSSPGFELFLFIGALSAVIAIYRRKKL